MHKPFRGIVWVLKIVWSVITIVKNAIIISLMSLCDVSYDILSCEIIERLN